MCYFKRIFQQLFFCFCIPGSNTLLFLLNYSKHTGPIVTTIIGTFQYQNFVLKCKNFPGLIHVVATNNTSIHLSTNNRTKLSYLFSATFGTTWHLHHWFVASVEQNTNMKCIYCRTKTGEK